jgi:hypothetical protein
MHSRYHPPSRRDLEYERDHSLATARMLLLCSAAGMVFWTLLIVAIVRYLAH